MEQAPVAPARRGRSKVFVALLSALAWAGCASVATPVQASPKHASMIVDANTGAVLHNSAGDELRHPASLTKMMTLYLAFEMIERGKLSYQSKVKISQEAASAAPSKLELEPGEEILLIDAMKALVTKSANDMAVAIAERIGGSEANFARLMTAKARQLGMKQTIFKNASGLPNDEQVTTARDMITLALHLQDDFPKHYPLFSLKSFTYSGASYRNHNTLLYSYRGTDGIKTGYTRMSGFNLVASVHRDGRHLIGAIFGGASAASRNVYLKALLDRSFAKASTTKSRKAAPMLVAKPAPAKRPAKAKPEPVAVAQVAKPKAAVVGERSGWELRPAKQAPEAPTVPAPSAAKPPPEPARQPQPAVLARADEASGPEIQIARVRRSMVAPRVSRPPVQASPADTASGPGAADDEATTRQQATAPKVVAGAAPQPAPSPPRPVATRPASPPAASPPAVARGLPPSTLQAQAANLAHSGRPFVTASLATPPAHLRGPINPEQPASGGYQIQVGAYANASEAEQRLTATRQMASGVLTGRQPLTIAVTKGSRQLYRARFGGFTATSAASACTELRRLSVDCFVNKAE